MLADDSGVRQESCPLKTVEHGEERFERYCEDLLRQYGERPLEIHESFRQQEQCSLEGNSVGYGEGCRSDSLSHGDSCRGDDLGM